MLASLALSLVFAAVPALVNAQDGGAPSSDSAGNYTYSCDATKCKIPTCNCASTSAPGGLTPAQTPMFVLFTADDAVQPYTINSVNQFLSQRKNPNGCPVKMTYFTSLAYTNYINVTEWYVAGNEIADHTMTHVEWPSSAEINGNLIALNALSGIPFSEIHGFRTPYLNFSAGTLEEVAASQFLYDSSTSSSVPVNDPNTDAYWPYTLDNGLANSCDNEGIQGTVCSGKPALPGLWEIPMYSIFDERGIEGIHLMDPWLDLPASGGTAPNDTATLSWMKNTFTAHYNGNRQPFGLYTHPIHVAPNVPGVLTPNSTIAMINQFLDWAQTQPNVWIITNYQLIQWMQNPTAIADLNNFAPFKCPVPQVSSAICDGIPANELGLVQQCPFSDFPFGTCYGCPTTPPTTADPNPQQATPTSGAAIRYRIPANCSTPFWDPIGNKCLCTDSSCSFTDMSRTIGPNNSTLTGGGNGTSTATSAPSYVPFNGNGAFGGVVINPAVWFTGFAVVAGVLLGAGSLL
ncbi:hypothetical protein FRB94_001685 [Tulasnella sp. JGI-2019a]|nr:hypothetical protein FRB93_007172 [Tulasnella sp. JGI-2019a]KAG9013580.1 hypothetical protein FRB94_001685 [Tulasnella sp. JGI-2019a]KAG9029200.1 hypothetical protein FRB95_005570 [Tulasnella sp. JGI-2019a]